MLRLDSYGKLPWEKKPDGRYWTHITLGQVGADLRYYSRKDDGEIIERVETVSEDGLFNDDSVKSLVGLPIVLAHPIEKTYQLNREGTRVGTILSTFGREDGKLIAETIVDDIRGVSIIDNLLKNNQFPEASSGYHLKDLKLRSDGKYEQIRGEYDHVAAPLMPGMARGGRDIVMRFDAKDAVSDRVLLEQIEASAKQIFDLGGNTKKVKDLIVRLDTKDILLKDVPPETEEVINALKARNDTLLNDLEGVEEVLEQVQSERDELKTRLDSTPTTVEQEVDVEEEIKIRIDAWRGLESVLANFGVASPIPDYKLNAAEIAKMGIKTVRPDINLDGVEGDEAIAIWKGIQMVSSKGEGRSLRQTRTDSFLQEQRTEGVQTPNKSKTAIAYENAHRTNRRGSK